MKLNCEIKGTIVGKSKKEFTDPKKGLVITNVLTIQTDEAGSKDSIIDVKVENIDGYELYQPVELMVTISDYMINNRYGISIREAE